MARWHFRMLNDSKRNLSFKKAVQYWIRKEGKIDVMDIGCGTGLLSMYAANVAKIRSIYAIECSEIMSKMSTEVFKENVRGKVVALITKHSMDVKVAEDIPEEVSLIFSETLDSGVFGEGILETLIHAKKHLLQPDGKIVPWKVKIFVAGYKSRSLTSNQILLNETFHEYLFIDNLHLIGKRDEPYDAEYTDKILDFKFVTSIAETLEVNFNDLNSMQQHFDGLIVKNFQLQSEVNHDFLDGFVAWFKLYLNENDEDNVISTELQSGSCWNQAIFKLKERVSLKKQQVLSLSMSCKEGVLKIHHELDLDPEKTYFEVDPNVLRFINDEDFLRDLEFAVSKHKGKFINGLDMSPFPYVGLMLLKDSRLDKLWCRKSNEELVKIIASKNVIDENRFVFIDEHQVPQSVTFELIILHPFHPLGELDNQTICEYSSYRQMLHPSGLMIPHKITLYGELVNSDWLRDSCRITDIGVKRFKIDKFINEFATEVHLDLDYGLDCERLTSAFKISEIHFYDELHETNLNVLLRDNDLPIHAIFFHHKIQFSRNVEEFSTNRKTQTSCFKRTAQILKNELFVDASSVKIFFVQNSGIIKCDVSTDVA